MIRVVLPVHLRTLARVEGEVELDVDGEPTVAAVLTALESRYPVLTGAIRDRSTEKRRPLVRYYACGRDLSHEPPDTVLPTAVREGTEPFLVVGSMAGG